MHKEEIVTKAKFVICIDNDIYYLGLNKELNEIELGSLNEALNINSYDKFAKAKESVNKLRKDHKYFNSKVVKVK